MTRSALSVALALAITSAFAQTSPNIIRLKEVTVTGNKLFNITPTEETKAYTAEAATVGTKTPANLRDIPQSVSIITTQNIEDRHVQTLDQLAKQTTGLRVLANDDGRSSVYARGYEYNEYSVDGLPAQMESINGNLPNLVAFDRVEVMRGPSGLFNSTTEMGGVLNLVRKRPSKDLKVNTELGISYPKGYTVMGDVGGSLNADGSLRGRVLAQTFGKENKNAKHNNHSETLYGALDWDIGNNTTAGIGYLYQQRHIKPDNGLPLQEDHLMKLPVHDYYGANWNYFKNNSHDIFADIKHEFADGGVAQATTRYAHRTVDYNYIFPGSAIDKKNMFLVSGTVAKDKQNAFTLDVNYSKPFATQQGVSEFVVGTDYKYLNSDREDARLRALSKTKINLDGLHNYPYTNLLEFAKSKGAYGYTETTLKELGLYGKFTYRPIQSLALIVGGRGSHWQIDNKNKVSNSTETKKDNAFTGYAGVVYDLNDNHSLYASYSSLYVPQTDVDINGNILKPRQGTQYEIGVKSSYFGDRLNTRLSLYQLTDKNAAAAPANPRASYRIAMGKRRMRGVELEATGALSDDWNISAGYSYLHSKIQQASTTRDDAIFLLMPKHTLNLWTSYDISPEWTVGGGLNAMSSFSSSAGIKASGYATADLMGRYQPTKNLSVQLNVNNVFNRHHYVRVGGANTFNIAGEDRNANLTFRYQF